MIFCGDAIRNIRNKKGIINTNTEAYKTKSSDTMSTSLSSPEVMPAKYINNNRHWIFGIHIHITPYRLLLRTLKILHILGYV